MRKQDELNDPNTCLNRAAPDEWLFVLRATDPAAPVAVRVWWAARELLGKNAPGDAQLAEALEWARRAEDGLASGEGVPGD